MSTRELAGTDDTTSGEPADPIAVDADDSISRCRTADVTPIEIRGEQLESTATPYLRELKTRLCERDHQPARVVVRATFDEPCSLDTQREVDRLGEYVRAAAFLGAGHVTVEVDAVAAPDRVEPALSSLVERARREGIALSVTGAEGVAV